MFKKISTIMFALSFVAPTFGQESKKSVCAQGVRSIGCLTAGTTAVLGGDVVLNANSEIRRLRNSGPSAAMMDPISIPDKRVRNFFDRMMEGEHFGITYKIVDANGNLQIVSKQLVYTGNAEKTLASIGKGQIIGMSRQRNPAKYRALMRDLREGRTTGVIAIGVGAAIFGAQAYVTSRENQIEQSESNIRVESYQQPKVRSAAQ